MLRAPFEVTDPRGARVADGEVVAAVKDEKLVSVGLFESPRSAPGTRASSTALRPLTADDLGRTQPRPTHPAPDAADLPPAPRASSLPPPRPSDRWHG